VFFAVAFLLIGCAVAGTDVAMMMATQRSASAHLVKIALEPPNALKSARLNNDSAKWITSYRIGWANVYPNRVELRPGNLFTVPRGIKPGAAQDVGDQTIPFDESAQSVIFLVAEVSFGMAATGRLTSRTSPPRPVFNFLDESGKPV
jgi:hypothetical protein